MLPQIIDRLKERVETERAMLAAGEKTRQRVKNWLQRTAVRALIVFFTLMLVFTLVSRMADSIAVARVKTDTVKSAVLSDRVTLNGSIGPLGDFQLSLPAGLQITALKASVGQQVKAGDVLMELDQDNINEQLEKLREKLHVLELRLAIANIGVSSSNANDVLAAEQAVKQAQADYERLKEKLGRNDQRAAADLRDAQAALTEALAVYDRAVEKAKADLIKAAQDKLKAAEAALETTRESADDAIRSAQYAYDAVLAQQDAANAAYQNALNNVHTAEARLNDAIQRLSALEAAESPDPSAIAAARTAVQTAQAELDAANRALQALENQAPINSQQALETLRKAQERGQKRIAEAQDAVNAVQAELDAVRAKKDMSDQPAVISAHGNIDSAERAIKSAERALEDAGLNGEDQLISAGRAIETAKRSLEQAQTRAADGALNDEKTRQLAEIERLGYLSEKRVLEQSIDVLDEIAQMGGTLVSPIDGTILAVAERGTTSEGSMVVVISRSDLGFSFTAQADQKAVDKLSAGDTGTLKYTSEGRANQVEAVIASIGAADENGQVQVSATLPEGTYPAGVSGELTVTQSSEKQNTCLPLSALRNDSGGDYVLVVREKKTVMGLEHTTERVPVTVVARDSETMAVNSTLLRDDQVIISANKPILEGDRVRLETE